MPVVSGAEPATGWPSRRCRRPRGVHRARRPYGEVGNAYTALQKWMTDNGRRPAGMVREIYLNDPGTVPAEELLTEIDWPIA